MEDFDLDSALDSKPSDVKQEMEANRPASSTGSSSKSNYNRGKVSLYNDTNIVPKDLKDLKFKSNASKFFSVYDNGKVPEDKLDIIRKACHWLFTKGFIYRSKGDLRSPVDNMIRSIPGARVMIYKLWEKADSPKEGFPIDSNAPTRIAYEVACGVHKTFTKQKDIVRCIIAREVQTLLGKDCDDPDAFILTYTPDGANAFTKSFKIENAGGVWMPMKIAISSNIPICNAGSDKFIDELKKLIGVIAPSESKPEVSKTEEPKVTTVAQPEPVEQPKTEELQVSEPLGDDIWG